MSADGCLFEESADANAHARIGDIRARGGLVLAVANDSGRTRITDLGESGGYRAKFPQSGTTLDAVAINTGGGLVGGDRVHFAIDVGPGAAMTFATQSAERVYRALDCASAVTASLTVAARGALAWLPQETILYDGARLDRRIDVDLASDATLVLAESVVFGRAAMGETVQSGNFRDRWNIRRAGLPLYMEAVAFDGNIQAQLEHPAIGAGARAAATIICVAHDAEDRRDAARDALADTAGRAAVSAWNGMLVARLLAPTGAALRRDLVRILTCLTRAPMPRVWNC